MKKSNLISPRQQRRDFKHIEDFLKALVIDLMYLVNKQVPEAEQEQHQIAVNVKYVELNQKWKHKCHDKDYGYMKLNIHAFAGNIQTLAKGSQVVNAEDIKPEDPNKPKVIKHRFNTQAEADAFIKKMNAQTIVPGKDNDKPNIQIVSK